MDGARVDAELVARLTPLAVRAARHHLLDRDDQLDAVQDGWLLLLVNVGAIRDPACLPRWLRTAVGRQAGRLARSRVRELACHAESTLDRDRRCAPSTEDSWLLTYRNRILWTMVDRLPVRERVLVELLAYEPGLSCRELANRLGISPSAAARQRSRSLRRLRSLLLAEGVEP